MAWALTQSGFSQSLAVMMKGLPGGPLGFLIVSAVAFVILGSVLEGIPAIVLFGPLLLCENPDCVSAQAMPVAAPMMSRIAPDSEAVETSIGARTAVRDPGRGGGGRGDRDRGLDHRHRLRDLRPGGALDVAEILVAVAPPHQRAQGDAEHQTRQQAAGELVIAFPALALPFVIRAAVVEGVATATEVSTIGIVWLRSSLR
jgi:TRAP-type C4-dicarboxylate transport system permease large subunit